MPSTSINKITQPSENANNNALVVATAIQMLENLHDGTYDYDLSGGNKTVDDSGNYTNNAINGVWNLTGTLSANRELIAPSRRWTRIVRNSTSGSFTAKVVLEASGAGIVVPQGSTKWLHCDGSVVYEVTLSSSVAANNITDATSLGVDLIKAANAAAAQALLGLGDAATKTVGTDVCELVGGKVPENRLPAIAISDTFVVDDEVEMLALSAQTGDIAKRTDNNQTYILQGDDPSDINDWVLLFDGGGGGGDVTGPGSSTANAIALFDMTTGKLLKNSVVIVDSNGVFTVPSTAAPSTPSAGKVVLYAKDKKIYIKNEDGTEYDLTTAGSGLTKYTEDVGDGSSSSFQVTHSLNTMDISSVLVRENASPYGVVQPTSIEIDDADNVTVTFSAPPTSNQYRVVVTG